MTASKMAPAAMSNVRITVASSSPLVGAALDWIGADAAMGKGKAVIKRFTRGAGGAVPTWLRHGVLTSAAGVMPSPASMGAEAGSARTLR